MVKNTRNSKLNVTYLLTISLLGGLVVVLAVLNFQLSQTLDEQKTKYNLELMQHASQAKIYSPCNRIEGGVAKQVPPSSNTTEVDGKIIPAMTEAEAKAKCKESVRRALESIKEKTPN